MLALACVPGLAQAESAEFQYEPDVPTVPNKENPPSDKDSGGSNNQSEPDAETSGSDPDAGVSGGSGGSNNNGGGADTGQGNQATGGGDGKQAGGADRAAGELKDAKPIASFDEGTASTSDDGSSSPLVPILIAIAVLAAISVGAFLYRQRRQDPTSPVSPKAS